MPDDESRVLACEAIEGTPALEFSAAGVERAVRAIQAGKLSYRGFCEAISAAGCVSYFVSLAGRRAVYYGRSCESYVEPFPAAR